MALVLINTGKNTDFFSIVTLFKYQINTSGFISEPQNARKK